MAAGHDTIIHLASNPDIARAVTEPAVDFDQGTLLTHHVVEAARRGGVARVLYASGSGVYGDLGRYEAPRTTGRWCPSRPTARASSPAKRCWPSYAAMFDITARAFRFGNVVGPRQTHGVGLRLRPPAARRSDPAAHSRRRSAEQVLHPRR